MLLCSIFLSQLKNPKIILSNNILFTSKSEQEKGKRRIKKNKKKNKQKHNRFCVHSISILCNNNLVDQLKILG